MRILAIDYGTQRVGLAISDPTGTIAQPLSVLPLKEFWHTLPKLIQEREVEEIVIGLPITLGGTESASTHAAREFADRLKAQTSLPVHLVDERLTSQMATRGFGGQTGTVDAIAASLLLEQFLNTKPKA
jgi:putative holliday junction resolvase